jgi:hypothetical protein
MTEINAAIIPAMPVYYPAHLTKRPLSFMMKNVKVLRKTYTTTNP